MESSTVSEIARLNNDIECNNNLLFQERAELNKGSQANFITQSLVLSRRSFVNMYRDRGYYWLRLVIYIMLGLGLGSVFYSIGSGYSSIQVSTLSSFL